MGVAAGAAAGGIGGAAAGGLDVEHAAACVKHSMLCAGRRGFVCLVPKESCRLMSQDATEFKAQAQKYNGKKKNPKGFFGSADWYENYEDFAKLLLDEN